MSPFDLAQRTLKLLQIPSVYGNEAALAAHMAAWAQSTGFPVHRDGNAMLIGEVSKSKPTIALCGHLDTVEPPDGEIPEPRIEGDRIFGLGSSDMKGGLAVACALAEQWKQHESKLELVLAFYDKEEGPDENNGLRRLLPMLNGVELAFVMEPTDGVVQLGSVGSMHATVVFSGVAAHSARPWLGRNAIHRGGRLLSVLEERAREVVDVDGLEFYEVISATTAAGGTGRTTVPHRFELNLNYRFAPGRTLESAEQHIRELVGDDADVTITDRAAAGAVCSSNRFVQDFLERSQTATAPKQAWTDVARLTQAGIDAVNFGPGETAQAHRVNESAPIALLDDVLEAFRSFFFR